LMKFASVTIAQPTEITMYVFFLRSVAGARKVNDITRGAMIIESTAKLCWSI
jgi:hypothetical protein